jgi:hypothetical protein
MTTKTKWRGRARNALEAYFKRRSFPRLALSLILALTGGFGFLISFALLKADLAAMWLRYPLAVLGAYGFFLLLLRFWVEIERHRFTPDEIEKLDFQNETFSESSLVREADSKMGWLDYLDIPSIGVDLFDEGCLPVLLIGAALGIVCALLLTVFAAPALIAEVFLDLVLVSLLYRRLKIASHEHWLSTAVRKTWGTAVIIALLLMAGGFILQIMVPEARSIGPATREVLAKWRN